MDMHGKQQHSHLFYNSANSANILCSNFEMMSQKTYMWSQDLSHLATPLIGAHRSKFVSHWLLALMAQTGGDMDRLARLLESSRGMDNRFWRPI